MQRVNIATDTPTNPPTHARTRVNPRLTLTSHGRVGGVAEIIAQRPRGCSLSRVRVNGVIIHLRPGGRTGIVTL